LFGNEYHIHFFLDRLKLEYIYATKWNIMSDMHLHLEEHLESSDMLSDIVIGMSDGLTVPFALAAGLSGAVSGNVSLIWIAGIAEISAMITLVCLFVFGFFKSKMTGVNPWLGGLKVMMIGAVAAAAAFGIARWIEG
jgi:VIT1/CCC1 family predicted Fe2+/Mn2+ transporter